MRVGDADREAIAAQLREHYADGRLTLDELNERLDQTFAAKTRADLNTVMRDLPYAAQPGVGVGGSGWAGPTWSGPMGKRSTGTTATARVSRDLAGRSPRSAPMGLVWVFIILSAVSCSASVAGNGRSRSFCSSRRWRCSGGCSGSGGGADRAAGAGHGGLGDRAARDSRSRGFRAGPAHLSLRGEVVGLANPGSR